MGKWSVSCCQPNNFRVLSYYPIYMPDKDIPCVWCWKNIIKGQKMPSWKDSFRSTCQSMSWLQKSCGRGKGFVATSCSNCTILVAFTRRRVVRLSCPRTTRETHLLEVWKCNPFLRLFEWRIIQTTNYKESRVKVKEIPHCRIKLVI